MSILLAHADKPTTPMTFRFRLWLLFNVTRVVGCLWILIWIEDLPGSFTVIGWHLWLNEPKSIKTLARNNGTRSRQAIFHVAPGGSVPNLEDLPSDLLRVETPSKIQPMCYEYYPAIVNTPTTPLTSRFRLWLLFNVIRVAGCLGLLVWIENLSGSFTVVDWHLRLNEPKSMKTLARNNGTRSRQAIFHVAPGDSVPNLEDLPSDLLRVETPSKIQPMCYEYYPAIVNTPTTPLTSRFRLWLLFNVIRVVGCLGLLVWIEDLPGSFTVIGWHLWLNEPKKIPEYPLTTLGFVVGMFYCAKLLRPGQRQVPLTLSVGGLDGSLPQLFFVPIKIGYSVRTLW